MKRTHHMARVVVLGDRGGARGDGRGVGRPGATQVDGIQTLVSVGDPFDPADDVYWMDGYGDGRPALIGCWRTTSFLLGVLTPVGCRHRQRDGSGSTAASTRTATACCDVLRSVRDRLYAHVHVLRQVRSRDVRPAPRALPPSDHARSGVASAGVTGVIQMLVTTRKRAAPTTAGT